MKDFNELPNLFDQYEQLEKSVDSIRFKEPFFNKTIKDSLYKNYGSKIHDDVLLIAKKAATVSDKEKAFYRVQHNVRTAKVSLKRILNDYHKTASKELLNQVKHEKEGTRWEEVIVFPVSPKAPFPYKRTGSSRFSQEVAQDLDAVSEFLDKLKDKPTKGALSSSLKQKGTWYKLISDMKRV
ncbi:TPA: hypothetical protein PMC50_002836 [Vibrio cholerae]|nr:hypothetical protein [Vibrio cholerae]